MDFDVESLRRAYLHLKSYTYHDNLNLFLRQRIAEFEVEDLDESLELLVDVLNDDDWQSNNQFKKWLKSIDYHLLPKSVEREEESYQNQHNKNNGLFISNVRGSEEYQVSRVNYFINAPVELHLIEVLWCLVAGQALESQLSRDTYGNRLHPAASSFLEGNNSNKSHELFKRFVEQYDKWRDQAISIATDLSHKGDDVALLSLDLKAYYYNIDLNYFKLIEHVETYFLEEQPERVELALKLTRILCEIFISYTKSVARRLRSTHVHCKNKSGLPIGFASSSIIANWYLSEFDSQIGDVVRPAYYGRYVDDIIMVFKRPQLDSSSPIPTFINTYLGKLITKTDDDSYSITVETNDLPIQKEKLILQYFDKNHSRAGLELFKQELNERSSAFKFLPSDHIDKELDKFAYDVLYDGSANKLRSIVGLAENESELSKYLSSHITAHRLCKLDKKDVVLPELKLFFKGQNALQFSRLWEKVYLYALVMRRYTFISDFFEDLESEIDKIKGVMPNSRRRARNLTTELHRDLRLYNKLSLALSVGLLDVNPSIFDVAFDSADIFTQTEKDKLENIVRTYEIHSFAVYFRVSNLVRHNVVAWPLANYSDYPGDLTDEEPFLSHADFDIDKDKLDLSPRFIHFDEWQLFSINKALKSKANLLDWMHSSRADYVSQIYGEGFPVNFGKPGESELGIVKSKFSIGDEHPQDKLRLAIANLKVNLSDIYAALRNDQKPNLSFSRQQKLYDILNSAIKEKADIVVMPEVSIPVSWLPFMVAFARRNQIALIFGLEHWVIGSYAFNLIIEALPFRIDNTYKSCAVTARIKNHYAPKELSDIDAFRLKAGNEPLKPNAYYHKVRWRGASFATYNCFELSDISHRVIFKSEIDLLFACVWNKDTNYYQHILESAVRDLHCYTVQSNTSQYGGSCVLKPSKTENKTMLYVKGGENSSVLTTEIDIKALRDFQFKSKPSEADKFKHLPPGFDSDSVIDR